MITILHSKTEIMDLVNMESSYLSNPVGNLEELNTMRMAELIPITKDHREVFSRLVNMAAKEIAIKLAPYSVGILIPFIVTKPDDALPQKDSAVFSFNLFDDQRAEVVVPKIEDAIRTALVKYVLKEWLKLRGHVEYYKLYESQWPEFLQEIKNAMEFGHKVKKTYKVM